MPRIQEIGPPSTPSLFIENQYQLSQQRISQQYKNLQQRYRRQQIDYDSALKEHADMQAESDAQTEAFQSNMRMVQQSQKFVDQGLYSPEDHQKAMWEQFLPEEIFEKMYPKPVVERQQREPFSPTEMVKYKDTVEYFGERGKLIKKKFGVDKWAKDVHTKKSLLKQYDTWKVNIGYSAMKFYEQAQVDNEWDNWAVDEEYDTGNPKTDVWNPGSKEIIAARGKGPLTKDYGSPARRTPTKPGEGVNPMANSIVLDLSKRTKSKAKPKKEQKTAEELRKENTSEAYELGRQLGYWN